MGLCVSISVGATLGAAPNFLFHATEHVESIYWRYLWCCVSRTAMYAQYMAPERQRTDESPVLGGRESEKSTKLYRCYSVIIRGAIPGDIEERVSKLHSVALRRHGRPNKEEGGPESGGSMTELDDAQADDSRALTQNE